MEHTARQQYFPFFSLTRELRDLIYGHFLEEAELEVRIEGCSNQVCVTQLDFSKIVPGPPAAAIRNGPPENPPGTIGRIPHNKYNGGSLVSKQFKEEYEKVLWRLAILVFKGEPSDHWERPIVAGSLKNIQCLEIRNAAECYDCCMPKAYCSCTTDNCGQIRAIVNNRKWISKLLPEFPKLQELTIKVGLAWPPDMDYTWPQTRNDINIHGALALYEEVPRLGMLGVYHSATGQYDTEEYHDFSPERLYGSWTKEQGWKAEKPILRDPEVAREEEEAERENRWDDEEDDDEE